MSRAAPLRFLAGVVALWVAGRAMVLELPPAALVTAARAATPPLAAARIPMRPWPAAPPPREPTTPHAGSSHDGGRHDAARTMPSLSPVDDPTGAAGPPGDIAVASIMPVADGFAGIGPGARAVAPGGPASGFDGPLLAVAPDALRAPRSRWSGEAYMFVRGRGGGERGGDAVGGTLGGSQAAARVAYRLDPAGRVALFVRGYAPLRGQGAEVSGGIEAHPLDGVPLRLAVERRQRADAAGRSAWEASIAGGVDALPLPGGLRLDAYAQGGVVGAHARDPFADGAARVGRPLPVAAGSLTIGAGVWGAAQPGAARLDLGPQAVLRLPEGRTALTLAIDWRLRAAGDARPGSGPALTLAADF